MHIQSMMRVFGTVSPPWPHRVLARLAIGAIALLAFAAADAQQLPVQQLTVAAANAYPNGSIYSLALAPNSAMISATNPLTRGGTLQNFFDALVWVTNPATSTLDLIYADAEQHKIWRLSGPSYQTPTLIFSWTGKGSGPAYPVGLSADGAGNLFVISPSCDWDDKPSVWVLPFTAGGYGAPLLIDKTFKDPTTHNPDRTLALAEVLVAGTAATAVGAAAPAWNALDLLVLVGDTFNARVIRYSQNQIQSVLSPPHAPLQGPTSTVLTQGQFYTQALFRIPPVPVGMDIWQDPTTQRVSLLFSTAGGRILDFDSSQNMFVTPFARGLGLGLTKLKVGSYQNIPYAFVGQLKPPVGGRILQFAAPPPGGTNTTAFASVSNGVSNPFGLAVTSSGSVMAGGCINTPCSILPQLSLEITGPGTANIPKNASIVADSCTVLADPRVTTTDGVYSCLDPEQITICGGDQTTNCVSPTLDLGNYCSNFPHVLLGPKFCAHSGATGASLYATKITATTVDQHINNTLTTFIVGPNVILPGNLNSQCGDPTGPIVAWAPLPGLESMIPEGNSLIDITVNCVPDPPPGGKGVHPSILIEGASLTGLDAAYIDGEFGFLQQAFNQIITPPVMPPTTQIVDPTGVVVPTIQGYITQSQTYFDQQNYNCALNTLGTAARYVNNTDNAHPEYFIAGPVPYDDQNPSGTLTTRFDHLYYDVNVFAGNPPITTDALNPLTILPACSSGLNAPSGLAFASNGNLYVANYGSGQVLVYAPNGPNKQMALQPALTINGLTNPVRLAFAPTGAPEAGYLFVADTGSNMVAIFDPGGKPYANPIGGLTRPLGVAVDGNGQIYVAENEGQGNSGPGNVNDIKAYGWPGPIILFTYTADANELPFQSVGALAYNGTDLLVGLPGEITFYPITDFTANGCNGSCPPIPDPNQTAITSPLDGVIGIAVDPKGFVYVTNYYGDPTFAQFAPGTGAPTGLNLGATNPALSNPQGIALDASGNIYVSNTSNNVIDVYHNGGAYWYTIQ